MLPVARIPVYLLLLGAALSIDSQYLYNFLYALTQCHLQMFANAFKVITYFHYQFCLAGTLG